MNDEPDLTIIRDTAQWKSEVRFQVSKVNVLKERLEGVRQLLRELESTDWANAELRRQLHQKIFN